jgi:hypothetical protein
MVRARRYRSYRGQACSHHPGLSQRERHQDARRVESKGAGTGAHRCCDRALAAGAEVSRAVMRRRKLGAIAILSCNPTAKSLQVNASQRKQMQAKKLSFICINFPESSLFKGLQAKK